MLVTKNEKKEIEDAIGEAERTTSGEIVVVIARSSGTYFFVPLLWASVIALALPWPLIYFTWEDVQTIYLLQLAVFAGAASLFSLRQLRFALAPKRMKRQAAHKRAVEQFMAQNLYTKTDHTGVLLFVSVAERYAAILADTAIHAKLTDKDWDQIVSDLTAQIAKGAAGVGLKRAVISIGQHLSAHFPTQGEPQNVLPNHLVILDHG